MDIKLIASTAASLVVIIAGLCGLTLSEDTVTTVILGVLVLGVSIYDIWKNHNFTTAAKLGQKVVDALKNEVLTEEEVSALLDKE